MTADYYLADTENGDHIDDPSEDALYILITELAHPDNTFMTVNPADPDADWYAAVSLLADGSYEVERRHPGRRGPTRTSSTDGSRIALDLTVWMAGHFPSH